MKKLLLGAALAVATLSASAQVSVSIGQPGFYGRIDMGGFAPAPLVYGPPVLASGYYSGAPVYLRVPVYQRRSWGRYCHLYNACGVRVLFVRDDWYANSYIPRYREYYRRGGPGWRGDGRGEFHGGGRGDYHGGGRDFHGGGRGEFHGGGPGRGPEHGHDGGGNHGGPGGPGGGGHGGGGHGGGGDHGGGGGHGGDHGR